nr:RdRp [Picobirnavirus sp.]
MKMLKNNTNSGLPFYTKKAKVKQRTLREFEYLKYRKDPCILFTRTQESMKTRNVWGYPMVDTLIEATYYFALLGFQKSQTWRAAIVSPEQVDKSITAIIDKATKDALSIVSIDFSSYDASISPNLSTEAFRYVKSLFQTVYHDTIDLMCKRFYSVGIVTPDGVMKSSHGVPSGSTFTNEIDSIVQYLIAKSSYLVTDENMQIQVMTEFIA